MWYSETFATSGTIINSNDIRKPMSNLSHHPKSRLNNILKTTCDSFLVYFTCFDRYWTFRDQNAPFFLIYGSSLTLYFPGFLSTADENSPGNYGILDQALALQWVRDNIEPFNGDSGSITLFGPGAGAASAGLLAVYPPTRDIVSKVIAQVIT